MLTVVLVRNLNDEPRIRFGPCLRHRVRPIADGPVHVVFVLDQQNQPSATMKMRFLVSHLQLIDALIILLLDAKRAARLH